MYKLLSKRIEAIENINNITKNKSMGLEPALGMCRMYKDRFVPTIRIAYISNSNLNQT